MDDFTSAERSSVNEYLQQTEYDDYDRLIQLCDFLGLLDRICRVQDRMDDILSRNPQAGTEHRANMEVKDQLQEHFESRRGMRLETLFAPFFLPHAFQAGRPTFFLLLPPADDA